MPAVEATQAACFPTNRAASRRMRYILAIHNPRGAPIVAWIIRSLFQQLPHHTDSNMRRSLLALALLGLVCAAGEGRWDNASP